MRNLIYGFAILVIASITIFAFIPPTNNQDQTVSIKMTVPQVNVVLKALSKLPYEESAQLINDIQVQANTQLAPPPTPAKPKSDTTKHKK